MRPLAITATFLSLGLVGCVSQQASPATSPATSTVSPSEVPADQTDTVVDTTVPVAPESTRPPTSAATTPTQAQNLVASMRGQGWRRVGLVAHNASVLSVGRTIDVLNEAPGIELMRIFSPEHGLASTADAGESVGDGVEPVTGLPIVSLYGVRRAPAPDHLDDLDVVVYDLQDVGVRAFTYIATMGLVIDAAAAAGVPVVVVDRPNPQGEIVDGPMLQPGLESFISPYPIPLTYGLSSGELARFLVEDGLVDADAEVTVVAPRPAIGPMWRAPSPNLPTLESAWLYPALVPLEATILSVGRGTRSPFTMVGAPGIDGVAVVDELAVRQTDAATGAIDFTPRSIPGMAVEPKYEGETIDGIGLSADAPLSAPVSLTVELLDAVMDVSGTRDQIIDRPDLFDRLIGTPEVRRALVANQPTEEIVALWADDVERFTKRVERLRR